MDLGSPGWRLRPWQGSEPGPLLPRVEGSQGHRPQGLRARAEQGEPPHQPLRHQLGPEGYEARMGGLSLFTPRTPQVSEWYQLAQETPCQKQTPHHAGPHSAELCVSPVPLMPQPHLPVPGPPAASEPGSALETGREASQYRPAHRLPGDRAPPRECRSAPSSVAPPRLRKQSPEEKGDTQAGRRAGAMPTACCPPPPPAPAPLSRNSPRNLPLSTTQRGAITCPGSHSRSMNQLPVFQWEGV